MRYQGPILSAQRLVHCHDPISPSQFRSQANLQRVPPPDLPAVYAQVGNVGDLGADEST